VGLPLWQAAHRTDLHARCDTYAIGAVVAYLCNNGMRGVWPRRL
jgi:hypothetical protein